jgi:hypothetical protein
MTSESPEPVGCQPFAGEQQPWQNRFEPVDPVSVLSQADEGFLSEVLCRVPIVGPRQHEAEDRAPVVLERTLVEEFRIANDGRHCHTHVNASRGRIARPA